MAEAIADRTRADTDDDAGALSLSEALAAFHTSAHDAQRACTDRRELTLFESQPVKVGRLIDLLVAGNYRDTAGTIAGLSSRALRLWMQKAEAGDPRYQPFAAVVTVAEALAEATAVRKVRQAGHDPRFWAAEMTYLERRHPDRWGRRLEGTNGPQVIVYIGGREQDIRVAIAVTTDRSPAPIDAALTNTDPELLD